jgi:hypothetical protein
VDTLVFRGYQLYYKYYSVDATPVSSFEDQTKMLAAGFTRVYSSDDSTYNTPSMSSIYNVLIDPDVSDREKNFFVWVSFWKNDPQYGDDPYLTISSTDPTFLSSHTIMLRRSVTDQSTGFCKPFREFASTDTDILTLYNEFLTKGSIQIAFYVVTYGIQDTTTPVYSIPVYLGALAIP